MDGEARKTERKRANAVVWSILVGFFLARHTLRHSTSPMLAIISSDRPAFHFNKPVSLKRGTRAEVRDWQRDREGETQRDGKGGGYQKIMRCVDGRVVGQWMTEGRKKYHKKYNDIQPRKVLPSLAHLLPPAAQRSAVPWEIQWPLRANLDVNFAWFVWLPWWWRERDRLERERVEATESMDCIPETRPVSV